MSARPWWPVVAVGLLAVAHAVGNVVGARSELLLSGGATAVAWLGAAIDGLVLVGAAFTVASARWFRPLQPSERRALGVALAVIGLFHLGLTLAWILRGSGIAAGARLALSLAVALAAGWMARTLLWREHDVFLCFNSRDRDEVGELKALLIDRGVRVWIDDAPGAIGGGRPWWTAIQEAIPHVHCVAAIVGAHGVGAVQPYEIGFAFAELRPRAGRVIPVILPSAPPDTRAPAVFEGLSWLREDDLDALARRLADDLGVTGR